MTDGSVKNAPGADRHAMPRLSAGAYTNSVTGATATMLLTVDTATNMLNVQNPPNDGVQAPRAAFSMRVPAAVAMDIMSDGTTNTGVVFAGGALHMLDLTTAALTTAWPGAAAARRQRHRHRRDAVKAIPGQPGTIARPRGYSNFRPVPLPLSRGRGGAGESASWGGGGDPAAPTALWRMDGNRHIFTACVAFCMPSHQPGLPIRPPAH